VKAFDPETGQVYKDNEGQLKEQLVVDWPVCDDLKCGKEYKIFFKWAKDLNNYHPDVKDTSSPHLHYNSVRYQTKLYDHRVKSFSIFSEEEQNFLRYYRWLREWPEFFMPKVLFCVLEDNQAQAEERLKTFHIKNDRILCTDVSALQALIPYVKRLLQLFPELKDIYQCETRICIELINQSPLDFNPGALSVSDFLQNKQQQLLHLRMVGTDEWTGLIKVYQVLKKTDCLIEGQYSVLKLKRLLQMNQWMDFSKLMQSTVTPHLLLIACEENLHVDGETETSVRKIFKAIKEQRTVKIILTTRSVGRTFAFLNHVGEETFGNEFKSRDEW
jgi:hypothetical protein